MTSISSYSRLYDSHRPRSPSFEVFLPPPKKLWMPRRCEFYKSGRVAHPFAIFAKGWGIDAANVLRLEWSTLYTRPIRQKEQP